MIKVEEELMQEIVIKHFKKEYQEQCKKIILSGLEEHWGFLDENLNPDLNNIELNYKDDIFLTAWLGSELIATGAAIIEKFNTAQIVRMSVQKEYRSKGIGKQLINELIVQLQKIGIDKIQLETVSSWKEVIGFYINIGFYKIKDENGDTYFEKILRGKHGE